MVTNIPAGLELLTALSTGAVGIGWLPVGLLAASAVSKLFSKKKQNDKEKERLMAADKAARAKHDVDEKRRIATLNFLAQGAKANNFSDINVSPEMLAPRPYTGAEPVAPSNAADVFDTLGDVAGGAASIFQQEQNDQAAEQKWKTWMCMAYPAAPGCAQGNVPAPTASPSSNVGSALPDFTPGSGEEYF